MKIAICDDSSKDLNNLYALLEEYFNEKNTKVFIDKFSNPKTLLNKLFLEGHEIYNIFILDMVLQQNGLDVANRITNIHPHATIIFQTSSSEYAIDAFKVRPFDYILKPLKKEQLFDCLDRLDDFFSESKKNIFQIKDSNLELTTIKIPDINYIESLNRRLLFHMIDGNIISTTSLRTKFIESIPFDFQQEQFILCHNSFIVNMNQIKTIRDSEFIMFNNKSVPISRRLLKKVKEKYVQYLVGE